MNEVLGKYLKSLPLRGLLGGFILAVVWTTPSLLQHAYSKNFQARPIVVLQVIATFLLPLCFLGFLWGWSERMKLERAIAANREQFDQATNGIIGRHAIKGMICGAAFIFFTFGTGFLLRFQSWDTEDHIISNLSDIAGGLFGGALVGLLVGVFTKRSLQRKAS
jgi:hypothetical protein